MAKTAGPATERDHLSRLAKLLPMWPHELADASVEGRRQRVGLLRRALRAERRRGLAGEWTYDLSRHAALLACYKVEATALDELERQPLPRMSR